MVERFIKSSKVINTGKASFRQIMFAAPKSTQISAKFCNSVRSVGPYCISFSWLMLFIDVA